MVAFDILFDIRHAASWGFYIVMYIFLTGLSAGSFVLSSLYRVFGIKRFRSSERLAAILAVILLVAAPFFLFLDLAQPFRMLNTLYLPNPSSVMSWGVYLLIVYPIVVFIYSWYLLRADIVRRMGREGTGLVSYAFSYIFVLGNTKLNTASLERDKGRAKLFATAGVPLAIAVHGYTGLILAVVVGRPLWHSFLTPILFLVSAIVSGLALLIIVSWEHAGLTGKKRPMGPRGLVGLGRVMGWMIILDLSLLGIEIGMIVGEGHAGEDTFWLITEGPLSPYFLATGILAGGIIPAILVFLPQRKLHHPTILASWLVLIGILAMRYNVIVGGQLLPPTGGDTIVESAISLEEIVNTVMILSVVYCVLFVSIKTLPLIPEKKEVGIKKKGSGGSKVLPDKGEIRINDEVLKEDPKRILATAGLLGKEVTRREFVRIFTVTAGATYIYLQSITEGPGLLRYIFPQPDTSGTGKRWGMVIDLERCIGCNSCTQACKNRFDLSAGTYRTWVVKYRRSDGAVGHLPRLCNHCDDPPCVSVCPVNATYKHGDGYVLQRPERCIGCKYCMSACPYEARFIDPRTNVVDKCTFCNELIEIGVEPECVHACPTGARIFGDFNDPGSPASKAVRTAGSTGLREDLGTGPMVIYTGIENAMASGEFKR
jgi:tetrathionate reductase subunit C